MTTITFTTTDAEDAAILALTAQQRVPETVEQFLARHLRHQVDFALSQQPTLAQKVDAAPDDVKAQIAELLKPAKGKP